VKNQYKLNKPRLILQFLGIFRNFASYPEILKKFREDETIELTISILKMYDTDKKICKNTMRLFSAIFFEKDNEGDKEIEMTEKIKMKAKK
jgi:hypothetical protein